MHRWKDDIKMVLKEVVSVETKVWAGQQQINKCLIPGWHNEYFSSPKHSENLWGTPSLPCNRYWQFFPGSRVAEAWSWPPTWAKIMKKWSYISTYTFMAYTGKILPSHFTLEEQGARVWIFPTWCIYRFCMIFRINNGNCRFSVFSDVETKLLNTYINMRLQMVKSLKWKP